LRAGGCGAYRNATERDEGSGGDTQVSCGRADSAYVGTADPKEVKDND